MGNVSSSTSNSVQQTRIDQTQVSNQSCETNISMDTNNITQNFTNVKVGDINFGQSSTVDINCVFENNLDQIVDLVFEAAATNKTETGSQRGLAGLLDLVNVNITSSTSRQEVESVIRQTMESSCQVNIDNSISNIEQNWLNVEAGDIIFSQTADVQGECILNNLAKLQTQLEGQIDQNNNAGGKKRIFVYIILGVVVVIIIISIISLIFGASKKKKETSCTQIPEVCAGEKGDILEVCLHALPPPPTPYCKNL